MNDLITKYLDKLCEGKGFIIDYKKIKENLNLSDKELGEFRDFLLKKKIVEEKDKTTALCEECFEQALIVNKEEGILKCSLGHQTIINPLFIKELKINNKNISEYLRKELKLPNVEYKEEGLLQKLDLDFISSTHYKDMDIKFLRSNKPIDIKSIYALTGSNLINEGLTIIFYNTKLLNKEIKVYLNLVPSIRILQFQDIMSKDFSSILDEIPKETLDKVKLQNWIKNKFESVTQTIIDPVTFLELISFNSDVIEKSSLCASTGKEKEFEKYVHQLLAGIGLRITPFGMEGQEIFDGLIDFTEKNGRDTKFIFYDAKSTGTPNSPSYERAISQKDEDEFSRYVSMFETMPTNNGKLYGGCFVAFDFNLQNMLNKVNQLRNRNMDKVNSSTKIIFLPLQSLIDLYSGIHKNRVEINSKFHESYILKFFGESLMNNEIEEIKKDPKYKIYESLKLSDSNAIYVLPAFVKIFINHILEKHPNNIGSKLLLEQNAKELSAKTNKRF